MKRSIVEVATDSDCDEAPVALAAPISPLAEPAPSNPRLTCRSCQHPSVVPQRGWATLACWQEVYIEQLESLPEFEADDVSDETFVRESGWYWVWHNRL